MHRWKALSCQVNILDPCKEDYISPPIFVKHSEFSMSDVDYYNALAIWTNDYELMNYI